MRRLRASSVLKARVSSCLIATSVLNASENMEVLIMKVSDSMNESFRLGLAKGPHCIAVHQTANAEMISATVAVSRGPCASSAIRVENNHLVPVDRRKALKRVQGERDRVLSGMIGVLSGRKGTVF